MSHDVRFHLAGLMGFPVMHSRSPLIHGHWMREHGLQGAYVPIAVPPAGLEEALRALPALGFAGVNLTVPHKEEALRLVDEIDDIAKRIGRKRESVTSFLTRFATRNPDCRIENESKRKNEPGYLYRTTDVWPALEKWLKDNPAD